MASDFWSRRKAKVAEEQAVEVKAAHEAVIAEQHKALEEKTDAEICEEFGLPDPDSLQPGDNIVAFMRDQIPERIKRRAMRALWRSNPVLACLDGLNDYDDDYTNLVTDMPGVPTSYQVGKGLTAHVEELQREKELAEGGHTESATVSEADEIALTDTDDQDSTTAADDAGIQQETHPEGEDTTKVVVAGSETDIQSDNELPATVRPRRMQFVFDEDT
ncbi:MAG: DUF3306 domain-containing protein [Thalassococcus sp.]|uniref:DUF3306 domain-containing protein n=1 Tax=Thalassococcus sp. TaxID=1928858 RepID=UPI001B13155C|nr:DUF3306 domain-containing protein [Thalassococcus sp.]MBO6867591.1 DUF3306 domain-containing protein [Thalassococcus sp.]